MVHAMVDGEPSSYQFAKAVDVAAGKEKIVELQSVRATGFNQIDKAGDFRCKPKRDLVIENVEPSANDVARAKGAGVIEAITNHGGPMTVAFHPPLV